MATSAAGAPLAQTKGAELERAEKETVAHGRAVAGEKRAESAAAIGEADGQEHQADDRDADGRRPWEKPVRNGRPAEGSAAPAEGPPPVKDPHGASGNQLDLSG
jgi:hypothetical protein